MTNLGMQLEYFPLSIRDFTASTGSLAPFYKFRRTIQSLRPKSKFNPWAFRHTINNSSQILRRNN